MNFQVEAFGPKTRLRRRWRARAIEQLRLQAIELQMAPIRSAFTSCFPITWP